MNKESFDFEVICYLSLINKRVFIYTKHYMDIDRYRSTAVSIPHSWKQLQRLKMKQDYVKFQKHVSVFNIKLYITIEVTYMLI